MVQLPNPFPGLLNNNQQAQATTTKPTYKFKRAGNKGTLMTLVLDESGSMMSCWDQTISGFNEFIEGQKGAPKSAGEGYLTLIKFDSPKIHTVYSNRKLSEVPVLDKSGYRPNGSTNLLDAVGTAINNVNEQLSTIKKKHRPGVIITIMTDGGENASTKFNHQQIKEMVAAAEAADWTFTFLGANIDSFAVGSTFGMTTANTVNYSTSDMIGTMQTVSASTTRMRTGKLAGLSTEDLYTSGIYTPEERSKLSK